MAVVPWRAPYPCVTVVVKATVSFRGEGPRRQTAFVAPRPFSAKGPDSDVDVPSLNDFVPNKKRCDIVIGGQLEMVPLPSGEMPLRHAIVRVNDDVLSFVVASAAPGWVPLRPPYVQGGRPVAGTPTFDPLSIDYVHEADFDYEQYLAAHSNLRSDEVRTGDIIVLDGLTSSSNRIEIELPRVGARAAIDPAHGDALEDVELFLDTVVVDIGDEVVDLVWRGFVRTIENFRHHIDRVLIGFVGDEAFEGEGEQEPSVEQAFEPILRELPRSVIAYAWELDDVLAGKEPPAVPAEDLELARYECLDCPAGSEPTLTLETHARIAAELLEGSKPRKDVLSPHDLDELAWALEERSLGERSAVVAESDETFQEAYARLFVAAQDALARPDDERFRPEDYAEITVRFETEDPRHVFRDHALTQGAWMRIDRKWQARMRHDERLAREVQNHLARERATRGERQEVAVNDDGSFLT